MRVQASACASVQVSVQALVQVRVLAPAPAQHWYKRRHKRRHKRLLRGTGGSPCACLGAKRGGPMPVQWGEKWGSEDPRISGCTKRLPCVAIGGRCGLALHDVGLALAALGLCMAMTCQGVPCVGGWRSGGLPV